MAANDEELIAHLAAGRSYDAVAQLAGVAKSTITRRMKRPAFRQRLRQARADVLERALGHLSKGCAEAAVALRNLLRSSSEKIKLSAAAAILGAEYKFRESEELAAEIAELTEAVAKLKRQEKRRTDREQRANGH